jgi:citrate synthase
VKPSKTQDLVTADEAATLLGVKKETLYVYVSRGMLTSTKKGRGQASLYRREELLRLKTRSDARAGRTAAHAGAWSGEPVLDSAITSIDLEEGPRYRGRAAVDLATHDVRFEAVARLLWGEPLDDAPFLPDPGLHVDAAKLARFLAEQLGEPTSFLAGLEGALLVMGRRDRVLGARFAGDGEVGLARGLVEALARAPLVVRDPSRDAMARGASGIAEKLVVALTGKRASPHVVKAVNRALVVIADHELNPSTFAARVAASTGASLAACLQAALATFSGPLHGGACERIEALVDDIGSPARADAVVRERLRMGLDLPGFGAGIYPRADPRSDVLLAIHDVARGAGAATVRALVLSVKKIGGEGAPRPSVDLALVALSRALKLPRGSATAIFAVGRSAGWIAHVLEQRASPSLLRPRARYVSRGADA